MCYIDETLIEGGKAAEQPWIMVAVAAVIRNPWAGQPDAPGADEIVIALGAASSGRPHHRIGNRYQDMEEMQVDQTGKSAAS